VAGIRSGGRPALLRTTVSRWLADPRLALPGDRKGLNHHPFAPAFGGGTESFAGRYLLYSQIDGSSADLTLLQGIR